ncbi:hypothetical protein ABIA38_000799 [Embleya sp. AB8]
MTADFPFTVGDFVHTYHSDGDQIGSGHVVSVDVVGGDVTVDLSDGRRASFPIDQVEAVPSSRRRNA